MNRGMPILGLVAFFVAGCGNGDPVSPELTGGSQLAAVAAPQPLRIFVSPNGDDENPGTRKAPFRTVQAAVDAVPEGEAARVLVGRGIYVGSVYLRSNVSIVGDGPANQTTRIVGSSGLPAIIGSSVEGVALSGLTVQAADGGSSDRSSIAISLDNSTDIVLSHNVIEAGSGQSGSAGIAGTDGRDGEAGGDAAFGGPSDFAIFIASVAAALLVQQDAIVELFMELFWGNAGQGGRGAGPHLNDFGQFLPMNFTRGPGGHGGDGGCGQVHVSGLDFDTAPGENGRDGRMEMGDQGGDGGPGGLGGPSSDNTLLITTGADGAPGSPGPAGLNGAVGSTLGTIVQGAYVPADGNDGSEGHGGGGGGGGGGASGAMSLFIAPICGSGGGGGGQGGEGGGGGTGGEGGGGSFGVVITGGSNAVISNNQIITRDGGAGGEGGSGGAGGTGGNGGKFGITSTILIFDAVCVFGEPATTPPFGCGGAGGQGGSGGIGGSGAPGGGGPSIGIFEDVSSTSIRFNNQFDLGTPGSSGAGVPGEGGEHKKAT